MAHERLQMGACISQLVLKVSACEQAAAWSAGLQRPSGSFRH